MATLSFTLESDAEVVGPLSLIIDGSDAEVVGPCGLELCSDAWVGDPAPIVIPDVPILSIPPNWESGVRQIISYGTLIRETLALNEERQLTRPRPLYGLKFRTLSLSARETSYIRKVLELAQDSAVGCPIWTDRTRLTANASIGATSLSVETIAGRLFHVFPLAIIWSDPFTWELLDVSGFTGDTTILLGAPLAGTWAAGSTWNTGAQVMPLAIGNLKRPDSGNITDEYGEMNIEFMEVFGDYYLQTERET